jgi:hypothetical protein
MSDNLEPIKRLSRDLANAAKLLSREEVRYLVDSYYQLQELRKANTNQVKSMTRGAKESGKAEPAEVLEWLRDETEKFEGQIKRALEKYAENQRVGRWALSIYGIGPVIAAALPAYIDIEKAPTAGHIWRFAGQDPTVRWEKGEKRPFNAGLKVLCWKIGQSFLKFSNAPECIYGHLLRERWKFEKENNVSGALAGQATEKLTRFKIKKTTEAYKWYSGQFAGPIARAYVLKGLDFSIDNVRQIPTVDEVAELLAGTLDKKKTELFTRNLNDVGFLDLSVLEKYVGTPMLPPAHVLQRACRYTAKLYLAHWQAVAWESKYGTKPVRPYVLDHVPGHVHFIAPPGWPCE